MANLVLMVVESGVPREALNDDALFIEGQRPEKVGGRFVWARDKFAAVFAALSVVPVVLPHLVCSPANYGKNNDPKCDLKCLVLH